MKLRWNSVYPVLSIFTTANTSVSNSRQRPTGEPSESRTVKFQALKEGNASTSATQRKILHYWCQEYHTIDCLAHICTLLSSLMAQTLFSCAASTPEALTRTCSDPGEICMGVFWPSQPRWMHQNFFFSRKYANRFAFSILRNCVMNLTSAFYLKWCKHGFCLLF